MDIDVASGNVARADAGRLECGVSTLLLLRYGTLSKAALKHRSPKSCYSDKPSLGPKALTNSVAIILFPRRAGKPQGAGGRRGRPGGSCFRRHATGPRPRRGRAPGNR